MQKYFSLLILSFSLLTTNMLSSQENLEKQIQDSTKTIEKLKYKQQPGLALAASKIFFSDKRYSISGFGEFNYVPVQDNIDRSVGDLELYYSGLYRFATFFGYRFSDKLIWNSEFQIEYLHYQNQDTGHEIVIEAFFDYLYKDYLKGRIGFYPLTIGYVNNNDEPIMFYSVNRSDVERLITPSTWIEFGLMFYGNISADWSYALSFTQGLNSQNYLSGTWVRQGREIRLDAPQSIAINPQLNYTGVEDLTLSISGYYGDSGQGRTVETNGEIQEVNAKINLTTAYAKYRLGEFRFVGVGAYGRLSDTDKIFELTNTEDSQGQVLGNEVYGYLFETGYDLLPLIRGNRKIASKESFLLDYNEMKLIAFARYERLNTHRNLNMNLMEFNRNENDLSIWTAGFNFNTKENIVFKINYQYRKNHFAGAVNSVNNLLEVGMGFIF